MDSNLACWCLESGEVVDGCLYKKTHVRALSGGAVQETKLPVAGEGRTPENADTQDPLGATAKLTCHRCNSGSNTHLSANIVLSALQWGSCAREEKQQSRGGFRLVVQGSLCSKTSGGGFEGVEES